MEKDQISQLIGDFGKWQAFIIFPLGIHFMFGSFQTLVTSFLSLEGDYYCKIEAPEGVFGSLSRWREFANPADKNGTVDKCNIYDFDYKTLSQMAIDDGKTVEDYGEIPMTKNCTEFVFDNKLSFDNSSFTSSIVTDFSLVCGDNWKVTLAQSLYMLGIFIGAAVSGIISDHFGRKKTIILFSTAMSIFSIAIAFANSMTTFIILRMLAALSSVGFWTTFFVYAMEMVGGKWKAILGIGFEFPWAVAYSILPGIAHVERDWRNLQLIIAVPPVIFLIAYYFIPESPRWLISQKRIVEAEAVLKKAVKVNKGMDMEHLDLKLEAKEEPKHKANILDLFKTRNILKNTIIQYVNWFTASFVYYALTFDSGTLIPGNIYINFAVSGLIEFPAYALCIFLLTKLGRRGPLAFMYFLIGVALLLVLAMPAKSTGVLAMATIGKFGAVCAFAIIYVQAAEIFPTVIRNTGIGTCSSMARVGAVLAPIIGREVGRVNRDLVFVIFSVASLLSGFLTLFLPETRGKTLPDSIEDGEAFGKGETAFTIFCKKKNQSTKNTQPEELGLENTAFEKSIPG